MLLPTKFRSKWASLFGKKIKRVLRSSTRRVKKKSYKSKTSVRYIKAQFMVLINSAAFSIPFRLSFSSRRWPGHLCKNRRSACKFSICKLLVGWWSKQINLIIMARQNVPREWVGRRFWDYRGDLEYFSRAPSLNLLWSMLGLAGRTASLHTLILLYTIGDDALEGNSKIT